MAQPAGAARHRTFDHWLHSLVAHACIDLARKRRRRVVEVELTPIHLTEALDHAADIADRDLLDRAMARLEPEARAVVVLHFYLDRTGESTMLSIDPVSGSYEEIGWSATVFPDWQRRAR